jgi:hypothetical protein
MPGGRLRPKRSEVVHVQNFDGRRRHVSVPDELAVIAGRVLPTAISPLGESA